VLAWRARYVEWTTVCFAAPGRQRFLEVVRWWLQTLLGFISLHANAEKTITKLRSCSYNRIELQILRLQ
jgi:hypothetical protein